MYTIVYIQNLTAPTHIYSIAKIYPHTKVQKLQNSIKFLHYDN